MEDNVELLTERQIMRGSSFINPKVNDGEDSKIKRSGSWQDGC